MHLLSRLKEQYEDIRQGHPGNRFQRHYDRHHRSGEPMWKRIAVIGLGALLILIGIAGGFAPLAPGLIVGIPGMMIIATQFRLMARWMDWLELRCRRLWHRVRG